MATNITGLITVNERDVYEIDGDPSTGVGVAAPLSTIAMRSDLGQLWLKYGALDTEWTQFGTSLGTGTVNPGNYLHLPIYVTNASGNVIDDMVTQNSQTIGVTIVPQPSRAAGIVYSIPNPGNAIAAADFILSEGNQSKNGDMRFNNDVYVTTLSSGKVVKTSTSGQLVTGQVILTTDVSGVLPIANGGTNSGTALTNNRIMWSSGGAIVEATALTNGQVFIGSTGSAPVAATLTGTSNQVNVAIGAGTITLSTPQDIAVASTPTFAGMTISTFSQGSVIFAGAAGILSQDNPKFFWDDTNFRLGLGTKIPARTLDVNGNAVVHGPFLINDATATKANYEILQSQVLTTNSSVTTLATISTASDTVILLEARVDALRTGGSSGAGGDCATYIRTARVKNVAGTVTVNALQSTYTSEDQSAWNATIDASGTDARIRVNGATSNNITWSATYIVQALS